MIDAARLANLKRDVKDALLNNKVIAFPIACRVAWHASGTFDARDGSGGSDGGTMRFEPEKSDPANAGLGIVRDMLHEVLQPVAARDQAVTHLMDQTTLEICDERTWPQVEV